MHNEMMQWMHGEKACLFLKYLLADEVIIKWKELNGISS
jgi:hypothetical protein